MAEAKKKVVKKKKKRNVPVGRIYVFSSYNNTIISITDEQGNTLAQSSSGRHGFRGPKKATPYAAGVVMRAAADQIKDVGMKEVSVYVKGIGSGRDGALRSINALGYNVKKIKDITPIPHNGCRPKKPRRV